MKRLTEGYLHRIVRSAIHNMLSEESRVSRRRFVNEGTVDDDISNIMKQVQELSKQESQLTNKINKMKSFAVDSPKDSEKRKAAIDEFTAERASIRQKKIQLNQKLRELEKGRKNNEVNVAKRLRDKGREIHGNISQTAPETPKTPQELVDKRSQSQKEIDSNEIQKHWESKYKQLVSNGYLIFPKAKRAMLLSGGRKKFYNESYTLEKFSKYVETAHPDKKLKITLIPRKKERKQLDDVAFFDVKLTLEDNVVSQGNDSAIKFDKTDVPYDSSNY